MSALVERIKTLPLRQAAASLPAIVKLLARLVGDRRIDRRRRLLALAALGYAIAPMDLVPDRIPLVGKLDDVLVLGLAVRTLLDGAPHSIIMEHWEGPPDALEAFDDAVGRLAGLVPGRVRWAVDTVTGS